MNSEPIKSTEVKDKRLLKATPMERKKLLFGDNSYNEYVAGVGLSLQRDCRVRVCRWPDSNCATSEILPRKIVL